MGITHFFKKAHNNKNSKTAEQRKKQTEEYLQSLNIPFNNYLPLIEEESQARIRNSKDIASRILILVYLAYVAEVPEEKENVITFLKTNLLWDKVSPDEKELYEKEDLTDQEKVDISWRTEAVWLLMWAINKVDELELPIEQVPIPEILFRVPKLLANPKDFIESARIRSTSEILDVSDLTYRLHWAARDANLNNQPIPADLDLSIVMERHYAINWITFYADEWDEVTTDT